MTVPNDMPVQVMSIQVFLSRPVAVSVKGLLNIKPDPRQIQEVTEIDCISPDCLLFALRLTSSRTIVVMVVVVAVSPIAYHVFEYKAIISELHDLKRSNGRDIMEVNMSDHNLARFSSIRG